MTGSTAGMGSACGSLATGELACEVLYRFVAATLADPRWGSWPTEADESVLRVATLALQELLAAQAAQFPPASRESWPVADPVGWVTAAARSIGNKAEHERVFGLITCHDCPPYETEYQPVTDAFFRAQELADIAGFYRAFGLTLRRDWGERPDHIALELEFMAWLFTKRRLAFEERTRGIDSAAERMAVCEQAREAFFRDHLGWWAGGFAQLLQQKAAEGPLAAAARLLGVLIAFDRYQLGLTLARQPVVARPVEEDPCEGCMASEPTLSDLKTDSEQPGQRRFVPRPDATASSTQDAAADKPLPRNFPENPLSLNPSAQVAVGKKLPPLPCRSESLP